MVEYSKNMTITDKKMIFIILICVDLVQSKKTLTKKLERIHGIYSCVFIVNIEQAFSCLVATKQTFICSNSTTETLKQCMKYVQS